MNTEIITNLSKVINNFLVRSLAFKLILVKFNLEMNLTF